MASRALRVAVARQRRSHAQAIRRLPPGAGTIEVDRLATRYLPDYALPYAVHNIARTTRDDAKVSKALLLLLEPLVQTAGDKGVAFLLAACADMSGHDDASGGDNTRRLRATASLGAEVVKKHFGKNVDALGEHHGARVARGPPGRGRPHARHRVVPLRDLRHARRERTQRPRVLFLGYSSAIP